MVARTSMLLGTLLCLGWSAPAGAVPIYESATLGPTGVTGGFTVSPTVFLGVRFEVTSTVQTGSIGGHFFASNPINIELFAAVVALSGSTDFPDSTDLSTSDVLGSALLAVPNPSVEVFAPLDVTLTPGWYAMLFGSGLLGATGSGAAATGNTDIGSPSYFFLNAGAYDNGNISQTRFVLNAVPEPSTALLLSAGFVAIAAQRRRRV